MKKGYWEVAHRSISDESAYKSADGRVATEAAWLNGKKERRTHAKSENS